MAGECNKKSKRLVQENWGQSIGSARSSARPTPATEQKWLDRSVGQLVIALRLDHMGQPIAPRAAGASRPVPF